MPPLNLSSTLFGRPIKPVSFVLMCTMLVFAQVAINDKGALTDSFWGDVIGVAALVVAVGFIYAWFRRSQRLAEFALLAAFGIWGFRFWALIFVTGMNSWDSEPVYLSFLWMMLAAGSWLLERADPHAISKNWGGTWTRR